MFNERTRNKNLVTLSLLKIGRFSRFFVWIFADVNRGEVVNLNEMLLNGSTPDSNVVVRVRIWLLGSSRQTLSVPRRVVMTQTTCWPLRGDRGTEKYNPKEKRKKEGNESASWPPAGSKPIWLLCISANSKPSWKRFWGLNRYAHYCHFNLGCCKF